MNSKFSIQDHEQEFINGTDSYIDKTSDLIFSFDNDVEMENNTVNMTTQQDYNSMSSTSLSFPSPISRSGYVVISYRGHGTKVEHPFTEIYKSDKSAQSHITSKDKWRTANPFPSTTSPTYPLPPPNDDRQTTTQRSSSLHLQAPLGLAHSPPPRSVTPRTRKFQDRMLLLLSLLPSERYLSPSPSIEEDYSGDEAEMRELDSDTRVASPGLPEHAATVDGPSGNSSLSSSTCSLLEFHENLSEFEEERWERVS